MASRFNTATHAGLIDHLRAKGVIKSNDVYATMLTVDRAIFVQENPYSDSPQAIGAGATISAPHMHAAALETLLPQLKPGNRILDVGSGSGYLTVCFANLVRDTPRGTQPNSLVVGIDRNAELVEKSRQNTIIYDKNWSKNGGLAYLVGDGWNGAPEFAPFDAIHVGAAAREVPTCLTEQLREGGLMVIPVNKRGGLPHEQELLLIKKGPEGKLQETKLMDVEYVPLVRQEGGR